jgi:hypothetical protein
VAWLAISMAVVVGVASGCRRPQTARQGRGPVAEGPRNELAFRSVELKIRGRIDKLTELSEAESIRVNEDGTVTHVLYGPGKLPAVPGERAAFARAEAKLDFVRFAALERQLAKTRALGLGERYDLSERIAIGTRPFAEAWLEIEAADSSRKRIHFTSAMSSTAPLELVDFVDMLTKAVAAPR